MQPDKSNKRRCHSDEEQGEISKYHFDFTIRLFFSSFGGVRGGFFLIFCLFLQSCNIVFHPEELVIAQLENTDDYETAINGMYVSLTDKLCISGFYYANLKGDDLYGEPPSFYVFKPNTGPSCKNESSGETSEEEYSSIWADLYSVIASANNIIFQYEKQKDTSTEIDKLVGEAYLIRAYCYFRLTRVYKRVVLIDNTDVNYSVELSPVKEIYEFIESDLLMAEQLLPENNNSARVPYVSTHKGTALAILAEVYLSWAGYPLKDASKYETSANTALDVIENSASYGFGLVEDFAALWSNTNLYNKESILTMYFPYTNSTKLLQSNYRFKTYDDSIYGNMFERQTFFSTETKFFNDYPRNYRKEVTFYDSVYYYFLNFPKWEYVKKYIRTDTLPVCAAMGFHKYFYDLIPMGKTDIYEQSFLGSQKLYLFRYAQTLLTYAEAAARSGNLNSKAYECLNMIRRRANHVDINTPSVFDIQQGLTVKQFADSVVQERAWELAGEPEGRWFDLVRLEMVEKLPELRDPDEFGFPSGTPTKDDYFYPIPNDDKFLNPNLLEE